MMRNHECYVNSTYEMDQVISQLNTLMKTEFKDLTYNNENVFPIDFLISFFNFVLNQAKEENEDHKVFLVIKTMLVKARNNFGKRMTF